jgi:hypothetical protein
MTPVTGGAVDGGVVDVGGVVTGGLVVVVVGDGRAWGSVVAGRAAVREFSTC